MICVINGAKRYLSLISYLREGTSLRINIGHVFFLQLPDYGSMLACLLPFLRAKLSKTLNVKKQLNVSMYTISELLKTSH